MNDMLALAELLDKHRLEIEEKDAKIAELEKERDSILQEAKIKNCELDTQSGIVKSICDLFDLRVKDYHCISKIKEALEIRDLEQKSQCCYALISETKLHRINGDTYVLMRDVNNYGVSLGHQANKLREGVNNIQGSDK